MFGEAEIYGAIGSPLGRQFTFTPAGGEGRTISALARHAGVKESTETGTRYVYQFTVTVGRNEAHALGGVARLPEPGDSLRVPSDDSGRVYYFAELLEEQPWSWRARFDSSRPYQVGTPQR